MDLNWACVVVARALSNLTETYILVEWALAKLPKITCVLVGQVLANPN